MRIGEIAERAGVGVETVRFYEREGLLPQPLKPQRGFRRYPEDAVRRIRFIRRAQVLGFTLGEVRDLLALESRADAGCVDVRSHARRKRQEIDRKIDHLRRIGLALEELIAACPGEGPARDCSILAAINSGRLNLEDNDGD